MAAEYGWGGSKRFERVFAREVKVREVFAECGKSDFRKGYDSITSSDRSTRSHHAMILTSHHVSISMTHLRDLNGCRTTVVDNFIEERVKAYTDAYNKERRLHEYGRKREKALRAIADLVIESTDDIQKNKVISVDVLISLDKAINGIKTKDASVKYTNPEGLRQLEAINELVVSFKRMLRIVFGD